MIGMIVDARLPLDQVRHSDGGPNGRVVTESLGPLTQRLFELVKLDAVQSGLASGTAGLLQTGGAMSLPSTVPATSRLGADAQKPGDLALAAAAVEESGGTKTALLELIKIALQSFGVSHAALDTANSKLFTILYRYQ